MKKANLIMSLIMIFTFISCVTYKADSLSVSTPDYNQRVQVSTPHYDGVLNTIGVASIASTTIAGGYLGYQSDLIKYNSGGEQATSRIGNALIGASIGFGTSYLMNRLFGWGKSKPVYDAQEWVYKANKNMILISETSNGLYLIPKKADQDYQIKNIADAKEFKSVFNNSTNQDSVFKTCLRYCSRNELPQIIYLFPTTTYLSEAKDKYIKTAYTYDEIMSAVKLYPEIKSNFENEFYNLIRTFDNAKDFKSRYPESKFFDEIVNRLSSSMNPDELPYLIELFNKQTSTVFTKEKYIKTRKTILAFFSALKRYPDTKLNIEFIDYKYNLMNSKVIYDKLLSIKPHLGDANFLRLSQDLKEETVKSIFNIIDTRNDYYGFINTLSNESWLFDIKKKYTDLAMSEINKINKLEQDQIRKDEYESAKNSGISSLIHFANKYPNTSEALEAKSKLDNYVHNNLQFTIKPFNWEAPGDRSFWGAWAENNRSWWKGAKNYNVFYAARLKNSSNNTLKVKITVQLNLLVTSGISIFRSTSEKTMTQNYYMTIEPDTQMPFVVLFDNISGGFELGGGLLSAGSKTSYADVPFTVKYEYCNETISTEVLNAQDNLIENVIKFKGNIETNNFEGSSINEMLAGAGGSDNGTLIVSYEAQYSKPSLTIYDSDGNAIKLDSWSDNGTKQGTYSLKRGKSYTVEVSECDNQFKINLNVRKMTLIIKKNCNSSIVREND